MALLTKDETKALINGVWTGKYSRDKLPYWLFDSLADGFEGAAVKGWGNALGVGAVKDLELEKALQENIYYFAANKTAHQLNDMHQVMIASEGRYDFVKKALKVNDKYNNHWYDTEYNTTQRIAKSGREWRRIQATKDLYPLLRYNAVQDGNTRDEHRALHGVTRPVDDAFWETYMPPLGWNCRCRVERLQSGAETDLSKVDFPEVDPQFSTRVDLSKKIWQDSHPYFGGLTPKAKVQVKKLVKKKVAKAKAKPKPKIDENRFIPEHLRPGSEYEAGKGITFKPEFFRKFDPEKPIAFRHSKREGSHFNPSAKRVVLNDGTRNQLSKYHTESVVYHEYGHALVDQRGLHGKWTEEGVMNAFRKELNKKHPKPVKVPVWDSQAANYKYVTKNISKAKYYDARLNALGRKVAKMKPETFERYGITKADAQEAIGSTMDALMAINPTYGYGHSKAYFKYYGMREHEYLAHCFENRFIGNPVFKKVMPELYEESIKFIDTLKPMQ